MLENESGNDREVSESKAQTRRGIFAATPFGIAAFGITRGIICIPRFSRAGKFIQNPRFFVFVSQPFRCSIPFPHFIISLDASFQSFLFSFIVFFSSSYYRALPLSQDRSDLRMMEPRDVFGESKISYYHLRPWKPSNLRPATETRIRNCSATSLPSDVSGLKKRGGIGHA